MYSSDKSPENMSREELLNEVTRLQNDNRELREILEVLGKELRKLAADIMS